MSTDRPLLVCLLPARNAAADLPGWFASVERFADAVIALDDGSTDETRAILASHPLVRILLTNPPRDSYAGWDDAANRNRLLAAAAELAPHWILSLDADERIPPDDAAALRRFLETEAIPGFAYGFRVFRMWESLEQYERAGLWVYRLFAYRPGQRFPDQRLHFVPIPTTIPPALWLRTTIRIQHLAGLTAERRRARYEKYRQADPDRAFQHSYRDLLAVPRGPLHPWEPRPPELPVLAPIADDGSVLGDAIPEPRAVLDEATPVLSAIVIARNDEATILRTVRSVVEQECPWPFEVIVVTSGTDRTAALVRDHFPQVTVIELPQPALPGEARNAGLRVARGEYISFPGSHVELPQGSLAARIRAHDRGYAMVTGTTLNGTRTWAGWASYFLDQAEVLPGRPSAELAGAPAHCSYTREALRRVGGFPPGLRAGEDTVVNERLAALGYRAYRAQEVQLIHHSPCRTPRVLLRHHFVRGQGLGRILLGRHRRRGRLLLSPTGWWLLGRAVPSRLWRTHRAVQAWGADLKGEYWRAVPLVVAGAVAYWAGTWAELLRRRPGQGLILLGRPVLTLAVVREAAGSPAVLVVRVDAVTRRGRVLRLPPGLLPDVPEASASAPLAAAVRRWLAGLGLAVDAVALITPGNRAFPWLDEAGAAPIRSAGQLKTPRPASRPRSLLRAVTQAPSTLRELRAAWRDAGAALEPNTAGGIRATLAWNALRLKTADILVERLREQTSISADGRPGAHRLLGRRLRCALARVAPPEHAPWPATEPSARTNYVRYVGTAQSRFRLGPLGRTIRPTVRRRIRQRAMGRMNKQVTGVR